MIELKNISKVYKNGKKVIDNLNLAIKDGEIFGFLGPNGAGKTTTIKMITGILEIDEGDIFSIRKFGKYRFEGIVGRTKKDNFIISINKYV